MWGKEARPEPEVTCSLTKKPTIFIEAVARQKIELLMGEYPHSEWLAHMIGRQSEKDNFFIEDISVPPHDVTGGASAEGKPLEFNKETGKYTFYEPENCVGFIHSHHHMGAFHSGTDQGYVDRNYPISITVAFGEKSGFAYDAVSYQRTPCGKAITGKCEVKYVQPPPMFDKGSFLDEARKNIEKGMKIWKNGSKEEKSIPVRGGDNEDAYVPMKYRLNSERKLGTQQPFRTIVTDKDGHVLSKTEMEDVLANSEERGD
jgi:hypothetical protein